MNAYPNEQNWQQPSFVPPVEAPDVDPDEGVLISVAYNPAWTKVLEGACTQLMQYASWQGTHDEKILAVNRANLLMDILQRDLSEMPAPFWDDETDVDAEEPDDMQPWYGGVTDPSAPPGELDFVESAALWIITGFVALATFEVGGLAPAILFHTTVEKFILIQKRGDVGETIRFVIDNQDITTIDTTPYSPGDLIEVPVIAPPGGGTHDLMIVQVS